MPCTNPTSSATPPHDRLSTADSDPGATAPQNGLIYLYDSSLEDVPDRLPSLPQSGSNQQRGVNMTRERLLRIIEEALAIADEALQEVVVVEEEDRQERPGALPTSHNGGLPGEGPDNPPPPSSGRRWPSPPPPSSLNQ